jgi:hypothetical protein
MPKASPPIVQERRQGRLVRVDAAGHTQQRQLLGEDQWTLIARSYQDSQAVTNSQAA